VNGSLRLGDYVEIRSRNKDTIRGEVVHLSPLTGMLYAPQNPVNTEFMEFTTSEAHVLLRKAHIGS